MKIKTHIKYYEQYIPYRCRKVRYKEIEEDVDAELKEISFNELKLAFIDNSYQGKGKIYTYNNKLWVSCPLSSICAGGESENYKTPLEAIKWWNMNGPQFYARWFIYETKKEMIKQVKSYMKNYMLVDGELYETTTEPYYNITTFGLGNNHGGTGIFVSYGRGYTKNYDYNALQWKEAYKHFKDVALNRGDTESVKGELNAKEIKVFMPELVKLKPNTKQYNY